MLAGYKAKVPFVVCSLVYASMYTRDKYANINENQSH